MPEHTTDTAVCILGNHPHPGLGRICAEHLTATSNRLRDLPQLCMRLVDVLVPGTSPAGEKVTTSKKVGSASAAALAALSLVGPGSTDVRRDARALIPQVRRWSTVSTYTTPTPSGLRRVQVRTWHSEIITDGRPGTARTCRCGEQHGTTGTPARVYADDQIGVPPPADWADMWVRRVRLLLGETAVPPRMATGGYAARWSGPDDRHRVHAVLPAVDRVAEHRQARLEAAAAAEWLRLSARQPRMLPAVAAYLLTQAAYRAALADARTTVANAVLGLRDDGARQRARVTATLSGQIGGRRTDRTSTEWAVRYGASRNAATVEVDAQLLAEWLPELAEVDPYAVAELGADLLALVAEIESALGDTRDDIWLGRCPTELRDAHGNPTGRICGAGIWQDPYHSRIECPRCHTVTAEAQWEVLAERIHTAWPIDFRRRYSLADRKAAEANTDRLPRCRSCERTMRVKWRETPTTRGHGRMWRVAALECPTGCIDGGTHE